MILNEKIKTLEDSVYQALEEEILSGMHKRGDSLTELSITKRLGVSRTPVRSALHRLNEEGLVEIIPNRGAVVVGVTVDDLIDTYRIRMRLEGLASSMAAAKITEEDLAALRESVELTEYYINKKDTEHIKELDTAFHSIIYKASGNRMLFRILSELHRNIKTYRKLSLSVPGRLECSAEEHRDILEAIAAGDCDLADKLTSEHIKRAMENMRAAMDGGAKAEDFATV